MGAFLTILLITGYYQLARRRMCWKQENDVLNSAVTDLIVQNCFGEIVGYLADYFNLEFQFIPFYDFLNKKFVKDFNLINNFVLMNLYYLIMGDTWPRSI